MKIVTVVGARPQFIKAAVVSQAIRRRDGLAEILIHTGQHYDDNMSAMFFRELGIAEPDHHLGVGSADHAAQTGRMLLALDELLPRLAADVVVVYGDTNSTLAGALAAAKRNLPVAHVEAGLRSYNRRMPEEINRVLTDHLSTLLFAPTTTAVENLKREGIVGPGVQLVGDVMYDAALKFAPAADKSDILKRLDLTERDYVLATIHRAENTDDALRLKVIFAALGSLSERLPVVVPLHPRTRQALAKLSLPTSGAGLRLVDPLGYLDMMALERRARLIVTDSGGVQKEAFFHRVPCVTLRGETEWTELVDLGVNRLVEPLDAGKTSEALAASLGASYTWPTDNPLYGGGQAAEAIAEHLAAQSC